MHALKGLASASVWLRLACLPPPASRVRRSCRLRDTLAAPGLLAHASVTETVKFCPMGPKLCSSRFFIAMLISQFRIVSLPLDELDAHLDAALESVLPSEAHSHALARAKSTLRMRSHTVPATEADASTTTAAGRAANWLGLTAMQARALIAAQHAAGYVTLAHTVRPYMISRCACAGFLMRSFCFGQQASS